MKINWLFKNSQIMNAQKGWLIAAVLLLLCSSSYSQKPIRSNITSAKGLKDYYQDYFPIGVAVAPRMLHGDDSALILSQFNSLTAENAMKMGPIHPREHEYYWKDADSIATFAKKHGMRLRGHNLCWHSQAPSWMFVNEKGDTVSKQVLLQRLKEHITTVVNRYKDVIYGWDVVNEAIDDRDSVFYRQSAWYKICGEDFIAKAFEYAHAADPKAVLFYNDYNTENPKKREKIYQTVRKLKEAGVAIHGVGLQGHWSLNNPSREELEKSIQMFSSLGLQVQVTEMDVSVYAGRQGGQLIQNQNQAAATFTGDMEQQQRDKYKMVFDVLRENKGKISGVTFWNVSDSYSWLDGRGRKNYPLLFDMNRQPKKAYWDVVNFVETK